MAAPTRHEASDQDMNGGESSEARKSALIAAHIEPHPGKPGIAEYRLRVEENGYPVWAVVASLENSEDAESVTRGYQISPEAVEAVRAFYERHRQAIDDRLAANRAH